MNEHITSRPATPEERVRVVEILQQEYCKTEWGLDADDPQAENDTTYIQYEHVIEHDLARIEDLIEGFSVTTYPTFFTDADLIELRVWEIDFLNTFQQFKHFPDGKLLRHKPLIYGNEKEIRTLKPETVST